MQPRRASIAVCVLLVLVLALGGSGWFGVNGPNYDSWSHACALFGVVVLCAGATAFISPPGLTRVRLVVAGCGVVAASLAGLASNQWFGDAHAPTQAAAVLAWFAFAALSVGAAALVVPRRGGKRR